MDKRDALSLPSGQNDREILTKAGSSFLPFQMRFNRQSEEEKASSLGAVCPTSLQVENAKRAAWELMWN